MALVRLTVTRSVSTYQGPTPVTVIVLPTGLLMPPTVKVLVVVVVVVVVVVAVAVAVAAAAAVIVEVVVVGRYS